MARRAVLGQRVLRLYIGLIAANLIAWAWAFAIFNAHPVLLGTALLAYALGLRHAVDADHIAAIDNVTRKLMNDGQQPVTVGFYFALGHSSFVAAAALVIAASTGTLLHRFPGIIETGGLIGTAISAMFLFAIAAVNATVLLALWRGLRQTGHGSADRELSASMLATRGLLGTLLSRVLRLVSRSWHMYAIGVLFALGFDTASEIGLLGIAAGQAVNGMPIWSVLVFPALFTAGMTLIDATDGVLMLKAYGWAFAERRRMLLYNLAMTGLSVVVAVLVGAIEVLGLAVERIGLSGRLNDVLVVVSENFGTVGAAIIAAFAATWLVSLLIGRIRAA